MVHIGPSLPPGWPEEGHRKRGPSQGNAEPLMPGLELEWLQPQPPGLGLRNLGNSCYLNSVLQCLTYTPPLANLAKAKAHSLACPLERCFLCLLEKRIRRSLTAPNLDLLSSEAPSDIYNRLSSISRTFVRGRQEDAHELVRFAVEALHRDCMRIARGPPYHAPLKESMVLALPGKAPATEISALFMGVLQNQVKCLECRHDSNTLEPAMDLSLDLHGAGTLDQALRNFAAVEVLDGNNKYMCDRCKRLVPARKQMTVKQAPNVLVVHLKRFDGIFGGKVQRAVAFRPTLDLSSFMSPQGPDTDPRYSLYAVLVHSGMTAHSGHYYAYVRTCKGWFLKDDSTVQQVRESEVLGAQAYMLFYVRMEGRGLLSEHPTPSAGRAVGAGRGMEEEPEAGPTLCREDDDTGGRGVIGPAMPPPGHRRRVEFGPPERGEEGGGGAHAGEGGGGSGNAPPGRNGGGSSERLSNGHATPSPRGGAGSGAAGGGAAGGGRGRGRKRTAREREEGAIEVVGGMLAGAGGGDGGSAERRDLVEAVRRDVHGSPGFSEWMREVRGSIGSDVRDALAAQEEAGGSLDRASAKRQAIGAEKVAALQRSLLQTIGQEFVHFQMRKVRRMLGVPDEE